MNWEQIESIENVVTTSYDSFDKAISIGLIIFYDHESQLQVLSTRSLSPICHCLNGDSSYYEVADESVLFKFGNTIKKLNIDSCTFELFCKTEEENISVLNSGFCIGSTSKRKPRIRRNEVISVVDNSVVYKWDDDKTLLTCEGEKFLFQTKFKGDLYLVNIKDDLRVWDIIIDDGIPGRRYYQHIESNNLLVQRYFSVDNHNLLRIDLSTGAILWELENSCSFYNYDESNCKLYGLRGKTFEMIDIDKGEREIQNELSEDLHIVPNLTYYCNGHLYFSGYVDNRTPIFGAVDVESGKLVFTQEVEMSGDKSFRKGLDRPVVVGNRLYVRDAMKTLHIFERV
ncbi:hypothetical protein LAG90_12045 [Marinilongibacter aquaticus]|uniref:hypothetical protein n=1 Tax=Marinilongibacter aquaticus TaxID=2975157 RepID=UPI0021BD5CD3|nr:hypothetical protein [Marinilongibacter aquaticus]UBM57549.1 hypothetical protein LAG90_12045 [Marinilongibacter aquaticus]